jgi:hypothetical protein
MAHLTSEKSKEHGRQEVACKEAYQEKGFGYGLHGQKHIRQSFFHSCVFRILDESRTQIRREILCGMSNHDHSSGTKMRKVCN